MAGRPTLTTEPSMKLRLEARMQAARVPYGCAAFASRGPWIIPASQGPWAVMGYIQE